MVERKRHLAKAVTYRFFGSVGTAAVAYAVTGDVRLGASVGVLDSVVKIGLYYVHERAWYRIRWGIRPVHTSPPPSLSALAPPARPDARAVGADVSAPQMLGSLPARGPV